MLRTASESGRGMSFHRLFGQFVTRNTFCRSADREMSLDDDVAPHLRYKHGEKRVIYLAARRAHRAPPSAIN